jgi:hypothetical protein
MSPEGVQPYPHQRPLWFAALVTTFGAPALFIAGIYLLDPFVTADLMPGGRQAFGAIIGGLLVGIPTSAFCMYLLGLPLILFLRNHNWLTVGTVCLAATLAGGLGAAFFLGMLFKTAPRWEGLWIGACGGLGGGIIFSIAARIGFRRMRRREVLA